MAELRSSLDGNSKETAYRTSRAPTRPVTNAVPRAAPKYLPITAIVCPANKSSIFFRGYVRAQEGRSNQLQHPLKPESR